ncbi:MAG: ABC transporter permease subunit [Hymenobacter sp.]|nr:MAG: ABC transporter permease subunit [Hymenobacter sp.]
MKRSLLSFCAWGWLTLVAATGLLAPWLPLPYDPATADLAQLAVPPGWQGPAPHYLGTDPLGRDLLAGLVFGARHLVLVLVPATVLATVAGALLGGAAGYWGNQRLRLPLLPLVLGLGTGWWWLRLPLAAGAGAALLLLVLSTYPRHRRLAFPLDSLVVGVVTLLGAIPRLLLLLVWAAGPPLGNGGLLLLLALLAWPDTARLIRTQMRRVRGEPFVEAALALGLPPGRVWWHHALPAACRPLYAFAPITLAALVGLDSTLGFLDINPTSSWGLLLGELRLEPSAWWLVAGPGLALLTTLLALQLLARRYSS